MGSLSVRVVIPLMAAGLTMFSGCCGFHGKWNDDLLSARMHSRGLYAQNQQLLAASEQASQMLAGLDNERQGLALQLDETKSQLTTANDRIKNLITERNDLKERFARAGDDSISDGSGVNSELSAAGFEYDPVTGLNKFRSDILFDLGSDAIRPEAHPVISEFASVVKSGTATGMRILVVGHTDDQNIVRPETALKHPTNWHLSTDRSDAVILELLKQGIEPDRIASMGYSEFHPLESSVSDTARQRNRRVELFVVPGDLSVAKWDPVNAIR